MVVRLLRRFAYVWFCLAATFILANAIAIWWMHGVDRLLEIFNPYNIWNTITVALTLSPGIAAYALADRLEHRAARQAVESLVHAYGAALEAFGTTKNCIVADCDRLPAPKERIKAALLVALAATQDRDMREHLKVAYVELSNFQPGVGSSPVTVDFPRADPNDHEAIVAAARAVAERGPEVQRWMEIAADEASRLAEELRRAGF